MLLFNYLYLFNSYVVFFNRKFFKVNLLTFGYIYSPFFLTLHFNRLISYYFFNYYCSFSIVPFLTSFYFIYFDSLYKFLIYDYNFVNYTYIPFFNESFNFNSNRFSFYYDYVKLTFFDIVFLLTYLFLILFYLLF